MLMRENSISEELLMPKLKTTKQMVDTLVFRKRNASLRLFDPNSARGSIEPVIIRQTHSTLLGSLDSNI